MKDIMIACHNSRQDNFDEQTVPGRIYDVIGTCIDAIPKTVCKKAIDDKEWRAIIVRGITAEAKKKLQIR